MAFLLAVLASFANALSAILQRIGVQNAPTETTMSISLISYALRRGVWLVGLALIGAGFVLQAVALRFGNLSAVQPIVTTELLFLVLILGVWFRYHLGWREWAGSVAAAGGLATFLAVAEPGGGNTVPGVSAWTEVFIAVGAVVVVAVALGFTGPRWFRAAMFGAAGALMFALSAALTKVFTTLVTEGWGHVFVHWEPYAMVGAGFIGFFFAQNAYHAGPITASQATLTIVDPLASVLIGVWLFGDRLRTGGWRGPIEALAMLVMFGGVFVLCQSPLVAGAKDEVHGDHLVRQTRHKPVGVDRQVDASA
ncbi:MAG TPA: DMT family transporter [Acidimicrobiales bacterium]|nr:DMT family transporter [Acidimicrobiales bacterium]